MDFGTLLLPVADGVEAVITDVIPLGIPIVLALAGVSIALKVLGKFGVRR